MKKLKEDKRKRSKDKSRGSNSSRIKIITWGGALIAASLLIYFLIIKPSMKEEVDREFMFKKEGELTFQDSTGQVKAKIDIEIADTEFDRQLGLMYRPQMDQNKGMLFIFPMEEMQSFWMRNTLIPLDMLFVNSDMKIVTIQRAIKTLSDQSYPSSLPAKYVVEVNGGFTVRYKIKEGDKISFTPYEPN